MPHKSLNDEKEVNLEKAWKLRLMGYSVKKIADTLGVSRYSVTRYLKKKIKESYNPEETSEEVKKIWVRLTSMEEEAWKNFAKTNAEKWFNVILKVLDKKLMILGFSKYNLNLNQNNVSVGLTAEELKELYAKWKLRSLA